MSSELSGLEGDLQYLAQRIGDTEQARGAIRVGPDKQHCLRLETCGDVALYSDFLMDSEGFVRERDRSLGVPTGGPLWWEMVEGAKIRASYGEAQTPVRLAPLQTEAHGCSEI